MFSSDTASSNIDIFLQSPLPNSTISTLRNLSLIFGAAFFNRLISVRVR